MYRPQTYKHPQFQSYKPPRPPPQPKPQPQQPPTPQPQPENIPGSEKLTVFLGSISAGVSDKWLEKLLKASGNLVVLKRVIGPTGKPQAFGFATFAEPDSVLRSIKTLNGKLIPSGDSNQPGKNLIVKADEKTRQFLDDYETTLLKTDEEEKAEVKAQEEVDNILKSMSDPQSMAQGPDNENKSESIDDLVPAHLKDLDADEIPEEQRQNTLSMIQMFRERSINKANEKKRNEQAKLEAQQRREQRDPINNKRWNNKQYELHNTPQSYNKPLGFVPSSTNLPSTSKQIDDDLNMNLDKALSMAEHDDQIENDRIHRRLRDRDLAFKDKERRFEIKERARLNEYERDLARDRANDSQDNSVREYSLQKLLSIDDDKLIEKGELFYENRRRWRSVRLQAKKKEELTDQADRVAEKEESEKLKKDTEAFLEQQAKDMEEFAKEQRKRGVLMDDGMPIKLSAAQAKAKAIEESTSNNQSNEHKPKKSAFSGDDDELDENGEPLQKRKLVKLDYTGIEPEDDLTPEQREATRRIKLREIANSIPEDYDKLSNIKINWNLINDNIIIKKLIPVAKSLMIDYFGEADEEMLEFVNEQLKSHQGIEIFVENLEPVMLDDSKTAATKIWRRLVFELNAIKNDLNTDNFNF